MIGKRTTAGETVTLDDVARASGFHRTTVSQVLNDAATCWASEATRLRIREAARALGYRPNPSARALRSGRTQVIGVVSPGFGVSSPHSRTVGLTEAAARLDYTVTLTSHPNDSESEDRVIRRLLDRGVEGLAIYPVDTGAHAELRRLVRAGFPVVTFDGANLLDFPSDDISVDYEALGRLQVRHLTRLGRRRLCLLNTVPEARVNAIREAAIRAELRKIRAPAPLETRLERGATGEFVEAEPLEEPLRAFLKKHRGRFDGLVGFDSLVSLAIRLLHEQRLRVPGDVAVVGGGNSMLASFGVMPLTSVSTGDDAVGVQAFELLMDRIAGRPPRRFRRRRAELTLIERVSTRGPSKE